VKLAVAAGVGVLALAGTAFADVPESKVRVGQYRGATSQGKAISFRYARMRLSKLNLGWRVDCPQQNFSVENSNRLGSFSIRGGRYKRIVIRVHFTVPFDFADGTRGTDQKSFRVVIRFPSRHRAVGTVSLVLKLFDPTGKQIDTCKMRHKTTFSAAHV
jgi:hypothetical protein